MLLNFFFAGSPKCISNLAKKQKLCVTLKFSFMFVCTLRDFKRSRQGTRHQLNIKEVIILHFFPTTTQYRQVGKLRNLYITCFCKVKPFFFLFACNVKRYYMLRHTLFFMCKICLKKLMSRLFSRRAKKRSQRIPTEIGIYDITAQANEPVCTYVSTVRGYKKGVLYHCTITPLLLLWKRRRVYSTGQFYHHHIKC